MGLRPERWPWPRARHYHHPHVAWKNLRITPGRLRH
jgi:hypothetical protein